MMGDVLIAVLIATASQATAAITSPPAGQTPAAAAGGTLAGLVAELEGNNPELLAAKHEVDVRAARVGPAGALPDPVLTVSSMTGFTRPPFFPASATPNAFRSLSFSQEFPFPGKRALRTSVAAADVDAERWSYEDTRRRLIADLKAAYLDYVLATRSAQLIADDKILADHLRRVAEEQFSVGRGAQQDVVKAQIEVSMLVERGLLAEGRRQTALAAVNLLLNHRPDTPLPTAATFVADAVPGDLVQLEAAIDANDAALHRDTARVRMNERAVTLARADLRPDFRLGLSAQRYVGDMPWMYGVDLMVSLPIYAARKQEPAIAEAAAALGESERTRDSTRAKAVSAVTAALIEAKSADQLVRLYADSVLPQSQLALDSSLSAYQAGSVDFLSVLTNFQALLAAQLSRLEQEVRRDQALVRLEPLVGTEFVK